MGTTSGEGRITVISGTVSQASPALLCDFKPAGGKVTQGPDGLPVNVYCVVNPATAGSFILGVKVAGLHTTASGQTENYFAVWPGMAKDLQVGDKTNGIGKVWAFLMNGDGTAAGTSSTLTFSCGVVSRREG